MNKDVHVGKQRGQQAKVADVSQEADLAGQTFPGVLLPTSAINPIASHDEMEFPLWQTPIEMFRQIEQEREVLFGHQPSCVKQKHVVSIGPAKRQHSGSSFRRF